MLVTARRWEAVGGNRELVYDVALWAFPAGVIGGRLYFLATSWNEIPPHWWGPFAVWDGGLGIWGGIALGTLVGSGCCAAAARTSRCSWTPPRPALLVAQAIGRIGNYFNQELFGEPSKLPWALEISPAHRPAGYVQYATFQPTFLYEMICNLLLAAALVWLGRHRTIRPPGLFALYVAGYSFARICEELHTHRPVPLHLRVARELLHRHAAVPGRPRMVREDPARRRGRRRRAAGAARSGSAERGSRSSLTALIERGSPQVWL